MSADRQAILDAFGVTEDELAHLDDLTGYRAARAAADAEHAAWQEWVKGELAALQGQVDAEVARLELDR